MQEKGLFEYFTDCITLKLADFDGRARRREYWGYVLFYSIIAFAFIFIDILLDLGLVLPKIVSLIFALPSLAVSVRRLHARVLYPLWAYPYPRCFLPALPLYRRQRV